jgi:hypothetical protein
VPHLVSSAVILNSSSGCGVTHVRARTSHGRHQMPCSIGTPSAIAPRTCAVPWHEHCDGADGRAVRVALDSSVGQPSGAGPRHPIGRFNIIQRGFKIIIRLRWPELRTLHSHRLQLGSVGQPLAELHAGVTSVVAGSIHSVVQG